MKRRPLAAASAPRAEVLGHFGDVVFAPQLGRAVLVGEEPVDQERCVQHDRLQMPYPGPPACLPSMSDENRSFTTCLVTCRFISEIEVVSGISFGHTCTQFCALPQS